MERKVREMSMERDVLLRQIEREDREKKVTPRRLSSKKDLNMSSNKNNLLSNQKPILSSVISTKSIINKFSEKTLERFI